MPISVDAEIQGEQQLSRRLLIVSDGVKDFTPPLRRINDEMLRSFQDNFSSRGGLFQGGWPKAKGDYGHPLLEDTGAMRGNFQGDVSHDRVVLSNPTSYFGYHQSNAPRGRLPRRIMMKIDSQRKDFIVKAFQSYIVELLRGQK